MTTHFRRLSSLFSKASSLKQAISILFVTVLISNVLGLVRNVIIANRVGVTYGSIAPLDTYYAAFVLPDLLYNILIVGALSSAILPLLVKIDTEQGEQEFWKSFNVLLSTGIVVIVAGLVVLYLLLPYGMRYFFPGFTAHNLQVATQMAQVMLLSPLFFTVSQLTTSALQAKKRFFAPALAPIVYNVSLVLAATMIPQAGINILVIGVILGAALHFLVQLPSLLSLGWKFSFKARIKHDHIHHVMKLMIPRTIALTSSQLLLIAFYRIASNFSGGSISIYELTDSLQTAPVLLLANTLAMAILPDFARHFTKSEHTEFEELIGKSIRLLLYIFLPVTLYLLLYRYPIIEVYVGLGRSIATSEVNHAVRTFAFFVISLFFQGAVLLLARAYFARSDTVRPTLITVFSLIVAWLSALFFAHSTNLEAAGLSLAFSIGSILNAVLLWLFLGEKASVLWRDSTGRLNFPPLLLGTVLSGVTLLAMRVIMPVLVAQLHVGVTYSRVLELLGSLVFGMSIYIYWSKLLNIEQWQLIRPNRNSIEK